MSPKRDEPDTCGCDCHMCIGYGGRVLLSDPLGALLACSKCEEFHKPVPPSNPHAIPEDRARWPFKCLPPQPYDPTEDGG